MIWLLQRILGVLEMSSALSSILAQIFPGLSFVFASDCLLKQVLAIMILNLEGCNGLMILNHTELLLEPINFNYLAEPIGQDLEHHCAITCHSTGRHIFFCVSKS